MTPAPTPTPTPVPFRTYRHHDNTRSDCKKDHDFTITVPRDWVRDFITCSSVGFEPRDEPARISVDLSREQNFSSDPHTALAQIAMEYGEVHVITDPLGIKLPVKVISTKMIANNGRNVISQELEVTISPISIYCKAYVSRRIILSATWSADSWTKRIFFVDGATCRRTNKPNAVLIQSLDSFRPIGSK